MLCQKCKKNQANTHVKQIINGKLTEMDLCSDCAAKMGFTTSFGSFPNIADMMSGFLGMPTMNALADEVKCGGCGATFSQISKSGKVGCAKCYETFYDRLLPSIKRIHGNTVHTGKRLRTARLKSGEGETPAAVREDKSELETLQEQLRSAVNAQEFEQAAALRDRINELKFRSKNEKNDSSVGEA